ncbi:unnamed protein product [Somion occarium]|uniref:Transmembrane protein n=1 Tax=Somion occarium TaxID=3059160 RepID=A0ABP1D731_9APHY
MPLLLNPLTPPPGLSLELVSQLQTAGYIAVSVITAWLWDVVLSSSEDAQMFIEHRVGIPELVYMLARIASGGYVLTAIGFIVSSKSGCNVVQTAIGWFGAFAVPLNSLLFFLRVRAVFLGSRIALAVFGFLWLSTLTSLTMPFGTKLGSTIVCGIGNVKPYTSAGYITLAVFDTTVFVAISWQILSMNLAETWRQRVRSFVGRDNMGQLSKALLQTGQSYYLATVGMNIFVLIVILTSAFPPSIRAALTIPNIALQNAMACRVFRLLKLTYVPGDGTTVASSRSQTQDLHFATRKTLQSQTTSDRTLHRHEGAEEIEMIPISNPPIQDEEAASCSPDSTVRTAMPTFANVEDVI